ncbi:helix-turn-helix transcriptional regulator [Bacillus sp. Marseille-Q3570]|uniref:ArsR/SmtB family transcription factor n=1 Tax=Bacillus sp. Marseille-Q3570 TaxID=2963522 RepID=UPI0021B74538|nr:metalloregulator ArsR/SmtB family transcription factor [Bacillus sp. Marseille-Q3570]
MSANPNMAEVAALLADPSRAEILMTLLDGRYHTASELAYAAAIKPQTASFHLAKMVQASLVAAEKSGRHRYYQLANKEVARILESFLSISQPKEVRSFKQSSQSKMLRKARTCYDHLAGQLGVSLTESMIESGYLDKEEKEFVVTPKGEEFYVDFGLNLTELRKKRRSFSRVCLDWSERKHHLAGALGKALTDQLFERNWVERVPTIRAVEITPTGKRELNKLFNLEFD